MKITIKFEENELDLSIRVMSGLKMYVNWLQISDAYRKIWSKDDLSVDVTETGDIIVEGDPKYENVVLSIIENAKNGAYDVE